MKITEYMLEKQLEQLKETGNEILESQEKIRGHCNEIIARLNETQGGSE